MTSRIRALVMSALVTATLGMTGTARAVNMQQLMQDTQRMSQDGTRMSLVWWIPQEFWEISLSANPAVTPEGRAQILKALDDYTIFVLVRAESGFGGMTALGSREDLLLNSKLEIGGQVISPIPLDSVSGGAYTIVAGMKPMLGRLLGQFGQLMELVVYPSKKDGKPIFDPKVAETFTYTLYEHTFTWHLPLGSLLPPKLDPRTKEQFPGNYQFNPYTGTRLTAAP